MKKNNEEIMERLLKARKLSDDELEQVTGGNGQNDDNSGNKNCFTEIFMSGGLTSPGDCAQCNLYDRCGNAGKLPIPQPLDTPLPTTDIIIKW